MSRFCGPGDQDQDHGEDPVEQKCTVGCGLGLRLGIFSAKENAVLAEEFCEGDYALFGNLLLHAGCGEGHADEIAQASDGGEEGENAGSLTVAQHIPKKCESDVVGVDVELLLFTDYNHLKVSAFNSH